MKHKDWLKNWLENYVKVSSKHRTKVVIINLYTTKCRISRFLLAFFVDLLYNKLNKFRLIKHQAFVKNTSNIFNGSKGFKMPSNYYYQKLNNDYRNAYD